MEKESKTYYTNLGNINFLNNESKYYPTRTTDEISKVFTHLFSKEDNSINKDEYFSLKIKKKYYENNFFEDKNRIRGYVNLDNTKGNVSIDYKDKPSQIIKIKRLLKSEDINVGYTSKTEQYLADLLEKDPSFAKEVINHLYLEFFTEPIYLLYIIEIMSNLNYIKMQPNNITMALNTLNHKNIAVQEASVAAFEKWEDPNNIEYLRSMELPSDWMRSYTEEVIEYLKGC